VHYSSIWSMPDAKTGNQRSRPAPLPEGSPELPSTAILRFNSILPSKVARYPAQPLLPARVVNAIAAVCAANPGVLSALDLVVAAQAASG
jgi:hypothetical protein